MTPDDELPVRDIDICLDPGLPEQSFTLWPDDELSIDEKDDIHIVLRHAVPGRVNEMVIIRGKFIRWVSERKAMRKLPSREAIDALLKELAQP